jgi:isopenicillin N synthase-like dioxygenase
MTSDADTGVPLVDLTPWFEGSVDDRTRLAQEVDRQLQRVGFLVVTGHGVPRELVEAVRTSGFAFFALPTEAKAQYASRVGGRGWLAIGAEANAYSEGTESPPDLKESFIVGAEGPSREGPDAAWFVPNVWPAEVPDLRPLLDAYLDRMRALADTLLELCSVALSEPPDFFARVTTAPSWSFQLNWYPGMAVTGVPQDGQFRIGPHTDFGTLTLLDRQPGSGGLQVDIDGEGWVDAPHVPGSLVVNTGDLLARWTGERWRSNRHRVLPPQSSSPDEELMSLVYFFEADPEAVVVPFEPPRGRTSGLPSVRAGDFVRERYDAITLD